MSSTALGATNKTENGIMFKSNAHEKFYYEKLKEVQYQDEYHMALFYCLGINDDTRRNIDRIYDFETGYVKPACLYEGWQTSGSKKIVRMAFNLYCNGTPSVDEDTTIEKKQYKEIIKEGMSESSINRMRKRAIKKIIQRWELEL